MAGRASAVAAPVAAGTAPGLGTVLAAARGAVALGPVAHAPRAAVAPAAPRVEASGAGAVAVQVWGARVS